MFIASMVEWKEKLRAAGLTDEFKTEPSFSISLSVSIDRNGHDSFREIGAFVDNVRRAASELGLDPNMLENLRDYTNSDHEVVTRYLSFLPQVKEGKRAYHQKYGIVMVNSIDWAESGICTLSEPGSDRKIARCQYESLEGREF